ncbi:hypothetical protein BurJ1DRAFT_1194 [Burkholderiales bacterium JOSHI_001]|nr:hypothetical protein BurJ1DRAFT_1194 [Burkholderiales bacterium JOSHI_001]
MQACWAQIVAFLQSTFSAQDQLLLYLMALLLVAGLVGAVLLSPLLQWAYVRGVQRFMGFRELAPPPQAWWERRVRRQRRPAAVEAASALSLAGCMRQREARIRRATLAAWATLALGSLALAPLQLDMGAGDTALMVVFVAALAAQPALVNLRPDGSKWVLLAGIVLIAGVALWSEQNRDGETWLGAVAIVGLPYLVCVHRTRRALVVPLAVLVAGVGLGLLVALVATSPGQCLNPGLQARGGDWAVLGVVMAGMVGGFTLCLWLSMRLLDGLAGLIDRGWLSDLSVVAIAGVAMITGFMTLSADHPRATVGVQLALWAAWCVAVFAVYVIALRRQALPQHGRRLLMLRVFSKDNRAERLLDTLQARWQLAGPVMEIGGPDLVKLNLDIHEVIAFLNFRLHELFQPAAVPAEVLARSLHLDLDREGRFRVNELFCFDTSWKAVVEQLLGLADVVLLDLRGFNRDRGGTAHEVERLADRGLLPRVVAVHDGSTDWAFFEGRVAGRGPDGQALALKVDARDKQALARCLDGLLAVADASPPGPA